MFRGKPDKSRSRKIERKHSDDGNKDKFDPQQKDERDYLGQELYGILQEVRQGITEKGEASDENK